MYKLFISKNCGLKNFRNRVFIIVMLFEKTIFFSVFSVNKGNEVNKEIKAQSAKSRN